MLSVISNTLALERQQNTYHIVGYQSQIVAWKEIWYKSQIITGYQANMQPYYYLGVLENDRLSNALYTIVSSENDIFKNIMHIYGFRGAYLYSIIMWV